MTCARPGDILWTRFKFAQSLTIGVHLLWVFLQWLCFALRASAAVAEGRVVPIGVVAEAMLRLEQFNL